MNFELVIYDADAKYVRSEGGSFKSDSAAKGYAGRMSKNMGGPVDVAFLDGRPWDERYITTAMPSEFHSTGYRFERLS